MKGRHIGYVPAEFAKLLVHHDNLIAMIRWIAQAEGIYGVGIVQILYLILAVCVLAGLVFLATALPAMRVSRVDPIEALRIE